MKSAFFCGACAITTIANCMNNLTTTVIPTIFIGGVTAIYFWGILDIIKSKADLEDKIDNILSQLKSDNLENPEEEKGKSR